MISKTGTDAPVAGASAWSMLSAARADYDRCVAAPYDEVLYEVSARIAATGSAGKADIGALVLWERIRADTPWARRLGAQPEHEVRKATAAAVTAVNDPQLSVPDAGRQGRAALAGLPGFGSGPALPSALLLAAAPSRMAVYDRRARLGLEKVGLAMPRSGGYGDYLERVELLRTTATANGVEWTARDVDLALFQVGAS